MPRKLRTAIGERAGSLGVSEMLAEVAAFAVHATPGADVAGVTLFQLDRVDTMVEPLAASAPFVADIDEIQCVILKEGPLHHRGAPAAHGAPGS
jgi:precorrin isomerase